MGLWVEIIDGTVVDLKSATVEDTLVWGGVWVDVSDLDPWPGPGWTYDGATFSPPVKPTVQRTILSGSEWVATFTDQEWKWLKAQRVLDTPAGNQLDQTMDAIRWTNSIDVLAPKMDGFYAWLLNNGIPGGQARIDELRAGVTE